MDGLQELEEKWGRAAELARQMGHELGPTNQNTGNGLQRWANCVGCRRGCVVRVGPGDQVRTSGDTLEAACPAVYVRKAA